jgi:hypothetical protein
MDQSAAARRERMVNNPERSDITFLVGLEAVKIYGHRVLLVSTNDVFQAMLESEFVERRTAEVVIPDIEPEVFIELLRYLYCDRPKITKEILMDLYSAANKYLIQDLKRLCLGSINEENALYIYIANERSLKFPEIVAGCKRIIVQKPFSILGQFGIQSLSVSELKDLLLSCSHRISKDQKLNLIAKWKFYKHIDIEDIEEQILRNTFSRVCVLKRTTEESGRLSALVSFKVTKTVHLVGLGLMLDSGITNVWIGLENRDNSHKYVNNYTTLAAMDLEKTENSRLQEVFFDETTFEPNVQYTLGLAYSNFDRNMTTHEMDATSADGIFQFLPDSDNKRSSIINYLILNNE